MIHYREFQNTNANIFPNQNQVLLLVRTEPYKWPPIFGIKIELLKEIEVNFQDANDKGEGSRKLFSFHPIWSRRNPDVCPYFTIKGHHNPEVVQRYLNGVKLDPVRKTLLCEPLSLKVLLL